MTFYQSKSMGRRYNRTKQKQGGTGANQYVQRDQFDPSAKTAEKMGRRYHRTKQKQGSNNQYVQVKSENSQFDTFHSTAEKLGRNEVLPRLKHWLEGAFLFTLNDDALYLWYLHSKRRLLAIRDDLRLLHKASGTVIVVAVGVVWPELCKR